MGLSAVTLGLTSCQLVKWLGLNNQEIELVQSNVPRDLSPDATQPELNQLVSGNSQFAFDLYRNLKDQSSNLFYSPFSISLALAMTYAGAHGDTERQMAQTLHFTLPQVRLHTAFDALDLALASRAHASTEKSTGFQLVIANSIWGQSGYSFLSSFLDILAEDYGAGLRLLDFQRATEQARVTINDWVSQQTAGKIENLLPQGILKPDTKLVLTNTIYFKAAWLYPFDKNLTRDGSFHLIDGDEVTTPMMKQTQHFQYGKGQGYQVVELPYEGQQLSMVIVLPEAGQFTAFEDSIDAQKLAVMLSNMELSDVHLTLPKFGFKSNSSLKQALVHMGMEDAFSDRADFSGMTGSRDLMLTDAIHGTFVSVDEAGTEAAAATAVIVGPTAMPPGPEVELTLDRPFLFLIRDVETGTILFLGHVLNPQG
ncbi:MAG: hypothetical protein A2Z21_10690 [Candidatus Fraserbacteria bacterium RBG_16_55_9]|uniref:Serpin domain-containing protein n=1 Tax=Fraserbacteria sp. (strain RBG_16_55_9) TaxID=1817864 RepID=A0A1F5UQ33_FRAXR|nr:MAG: hypothetical protein A2Z21_10690 [Candidatus Fraserbacteria bacterium RBG_16_55_9]